MIHLVNHLVKRAGQRVKENGLSDAPNPMPSGIRPAIEDIESLPDQALLPKGWEAERGRPNDSSVAICSVLIDITTLIG